MGDIRDVTVVIPAYREEENLRLLLPRLNALLRRSGLLHEVLVVDTALPTDSTADLCRELGVRCVSRWPSDCYGDAVRSGIREARHGWIAFMDADGSHAPEQLGALLEAMPGNDVVVGSRYVDGGHTDNPWALRAMSRVVNIVYSIVLGLPVRDVSNSFKVYRADQLRALDLRCDNFDIIEEVLFKIRRRWPHSRMVEVPVAFRQRMFGKTKRNLFVFMLSYLATLVRLRLSARD